jgi:subtilase family serine protease
MGFLRLVRSTAPVLLFVCSLNLQASGLRIKGGVDSSSRATLAGNVSPRLIASTDLGSAPASHVLPLMSLHFSMTSEQQASLTQLLADQQNPSSPRYHQWLTPEQFGARFGLAAGDKAQVTAWLASQGFTITSVARGGLFIQFSGTVEQAQKAFSTEIHTVLVHGEQHIANMTEPSLPKTIAAITAGISGLDDFKANAHVNPAAALSKPSAANKIFKPLYTSGSTNYIAPGDFYTIYDESPLLTSNIKGTGVSIVVAGQTDIYPADIAAFQKAAGLANKPATVQLYGGDPGFTNNVDLLGSEQAIEWTGAVAPGATIIYVNTIDALFGSVPLAIDNNLAPVIASFYGNCESFYGTSTIIYYSQILQQAASQGITVTTASGEFGGTDCDTTGGSAVGGFAVDFPGSSPYVTSVGGTEFAESGGTYWSGTNGTNGGSALSYIPEMVWNDDSSSQLLASGGGTSFYFSKPAWQTGVGVPADASRDVPDVAMSASPFHDPYLVCTQGYCTNGFANGSGAFDAGGGTAMSSSVFAGLMALVIQKTGAGIGVANPALYALANSSYGSKVFHDVKTGTNASACAQGSLNCPASGVIGYPATTGYDQATGWGSVDAFQMVSDWSLVQGTPLNPALAFSITNIEGSANAVTAGTSVTFTAKVASGVTTSTATPTGSVQFLVDNVLSGTAVGLSSGSASYPLNTTGLTTGSHSVQAVYSGDPTYQGSKATFLLTITASSTPDFTVTPSTATITSNAGSEGPGLTLTVAGLNGFAGNVQFSAGSLTTLGAQVAFTTNPVTISTTTTSGTTIMTLLAFLTKAENTAPTDLQQMHSRHSGLYGCVALAGLLAMLFLPRKRSFAGAVRISLMVVLMAMAAMGISGCSKTPAAPASTGLSITPTPTGTYSVVVTATGTVNGAAITHVVNVTFVVQ